MTKNDKLHLVKDLPENVLKDAMNYVSDCSVALIGLSRDDKIISEAIASGTLISIKNIFGVLTARHAWEMFRDHSKVHNIHFSILRYPYFISELRSYINPIMPDIDADICFLELPARIVSTIKAYRVFYPLKKENLPIIKNIKEDLWLTFGFPAEMKSDEKKIIMPLPYFTNIVTYSDDKNGYDEIELIVSYKDSNIDKIPKTLGGMSGGGIWNFKIFSNDDNEGVCFLGKSQSEKRLVGVNFWETSLEDGERRIKGVGPISIYHILFNKVCTL